MPSDSWTPRRLLGSSLTCSSSWERSAAWETKALKAGAGQMGGTAGAKQNQPANSRAGSPRMLPVERRDKPKGGLGLAFGTASHHGRRIPEGSHSFPLPPKQQTPTSTPPSGTS